MRKHLIIATTVFLAATAFAQTQQQSQPPQSQTAAPKEIHSMDLNALDKAVDPCTDFYQFSCGNWIKSNPLPADRGIYGRFHELDDHNMAILRQILEKASSTKAASGTNEQKIGDYYASCMDETAINAKGIAPLKAELDKIAAIKSKAELPTFLATLHQRGARPFFSFGSEPDAKNAKMMIAATDQGGIGLPDRDYYFKEDAKSVETRDQYVKHVAHMFELTGDQPEVAAAKAKTVMRIETALAKASLDNVARRDPQKLYHKTTVKELATISPAFDWNKYFVATGAPKFDALNVAVPDFVKQVSATIQAEQLDDLKTYMSWQMISLASPFLTQGFVEENFDFYGRKLTGAKQLRPRWKRCVEFTDVDLGEALGKTYVDQTFGAEGKKRMLEMVHNLEQALAQDIKALPWMTEETKKQAMVKLQAITNKIGYPDKWRDYSKLNIVRGEALGNSLRANEFESKRRQAKIGKPVDKTEWLMTPPTVNAYYNPLENNINFPAGILQPPFFDRSVDDSVNYGGIGAVIGHELTHGFDDEGRQFDAEGNLRDWWTAQDAKAFEERASCIVDQYGSYTAVDDVKLNGKLTLGENTADNGGLRIALMALQNSGGLKGEAKDGFTPEQRFFLGWAQVWCTNASPESLRLRAQTDPHSPGKYRVNGTVSNMPEFQKAFSCKPGSAMVSQKACRVW